VIRLPGTFTSIAFTDTSENWHGFTVGVAALSNGVPTIIVLLGIGLAGLFVARRVAPGTL
jgi:hypothetical protein